MDKKIDNPLCPYCAESIDVDELKTKVILKFKDTSTGFFDNIVSTYKKYATVALICPKCNKILGFID